MECNIEIILIGGPTASGKSQLCCLLAKYLHTSIISADSMSVYKHMNIGTAKSEGCIQEVKHYLVDVVEPGFVFDAKLFEEKALQAIEEIRREDKIPIVCGGTYLYMQAILYGIDETPPPNWYIRKRLYLIAQKRGKEFLYSKLLAVDPTYASKISPNDTKRVVRALEVFLQSGKPFSHFHRWSESRFNYLGVYVKRSWESLSKRIENRVYRMLEMGLINEIKNLMDMGFENFITSPQAIGYKEFIPFINEKINLEQAINETIKNTKEYAKRQIRWFRKQNWLEIDLDKLTYNQGVELILSKLCLKDLKH